MFHPWKGQKRTQAWKRLCAGLGLGWLAIAGGAHAEVIYQETFRNGLGAFTATGSVYTGSYGARLRGGIGTSTITSSTINTSGFTGIKLNTTRATSGLDAGEAGVVSVSINGGPFVTLESQRNVSGPVSFPLAEGTTSVRLRFSLNANSFLETYEIASVALEGTRGDGGGGGPTDPPPDGATPPAIGNFVTFESGHVRPLALSADGQRLYAVNTPDNSVEVYNTAGATPVHIETIPVGLEPVALALSGDGELWVVNHLSDSVSVVDITTSPARVVNTLLVGDEPRDIVFAGPDNKWAFITAAHRGQNVPFDPQLTTPGIGRADVWVFDRNNPGDKLGGSPVTILNMFGDTMRALTRNGDGTRVYAAVFNSGNRTTVLDEDIGEGGIAKAPPFTSADGAQQPRTGLIVQFNGQNWVDSGDPITGTPPKVWNNRVKLSLPDYDVFTIDTSGSTPRVIGQVSGVGTTLFNMAVNPANGKVYVSNTEALNLTRFEGPGTRSTTVRGHFVESRITVVSNGQAQPRHLNKHITSYNQPLGTEQERALALATPLGMAVTSDGEQLFLAAMGSNKLARFDTTELESGSFQPSAGNQLVLSGGGPTGVVLDEARNRAYVLTRFDNGISVVNTATLTETAHVKMFNPEPAVVVNGRPFLYDATLSSSRGDSSCAGCHIFGDKDELAWDLGNPDGVRVNSPNRYNANIPRIGRNTVFHPMKGPMTTQSLRGLKNHGPMHWRGDRTGVSRDANETLEEQSFEDFNIAFVDLLGRGQQLTAAQMDAFAKFALELTYPPNPIRNLDNSLTAQQQRGRDLYHNQNADFISTCNGCHVLNREAGFFGSDGTQAIEGGDVDEDMKIPHLRNMYTKIGMFGENTLRTGATHLGNQIRGFGFDNQGASGTIEKFLDAPVFRFNLQQRLDVEQFVLAFDSNLDPIVGQQVTVTPTNASRSDVSARLNLLVQRATVARAECELVAKSVLGDRAVGWVMNKDRQFVPDDSRVGASTLAALLQTAANAGAPVTFTCVPPGNGTRIGIDRDADGVRNRNDV